MKVTNYTNNVVITLWNKQRLFNWTRCSPGNEGKQQRCTQSHAANWIPYHYQLRFV